MKTLGIAFIYYFILLVVFRVDVCIRGKKYGDSCNRIIPYLIYSTIATLVMGLPFYGMLFFAK